MNASLQSSDAYIRQLERMAARPAGKEAGWLAALRRKGLDGFAEQGFPTVKNEDWRYTNVGKLMQVPFRPVSPGELRLDGQRSAQDLARRAEWASKDRRAAVLVFVNGHFLAERSSVKDLGSGVDVGSLRAELERSPGSLEAYLGRVVDPCAHGFSALNTAFFSDGAFIHLGQGATVKQPIHLLFLSAPLPEPTVSYPRCLIVAEAGSSAVIVSDYSGAPGQEAYLTDAATEIVLCRGASVTHCKIQRESDKAVHVERIGVEQQAGSSFFSYAFAFGAGLSRTEIATVLDGEEAGCSLYGLYLAGGSRHVDHHTVIDHASPRTSSQELYKGVLDGRARGVFTGRVVVRQDSQKVRAQQVNKNLLLSEGALVETRPQLEIYADDVVCTHGATVGRLDEDALFYLRSRGLDESEARSLLTYGFASEIVQALPIEDLRGMLEKSVRRAILAPSRGRQSA